MPVFRVGKREVADAHGFVADVAARMKNRIQLSSDGLTVYPGAVEAAFGSEVDYGTIVKTFRTTEGEGRYSPGQMERAVRESVVGEKFRTCTSYVERQSGLTMAAFARREKINYSTFAGWRLRRERKSRRRQKAVRFAEVRLGTPLAPAAAGLEVRLADGTVVRDSVVADVAPLVRSLRE